VILKETAEEKLSGLARKLMHGNCNPTFTMEKKCKGVRVQISWKDQ
jgi:hypothetical protein